MERDLEQKLKKCEEKYGDFHFILRKTRYESKNID